MAYEDDYPKSVEELAHEEVSGIAFVRDYVEIHFDGPIFRCLSPPIIIIGDQEFRFPAPGSRDALCSLIGAEFWDIFEEDGVELTLVFRNGSKVIVPLDDARRTGPESAHFFRGPDAPMDIW